MDWITRWWRHRMHAVAVAAVEAAEREAQTRRLADLDTQRRALDERARSLYNYATQAQEPAEKRRLYCLAMAAEARSHALMWTMGGDDQTAAIHVRDAQDYERMAGAPKEAAHA
jgi:hypothetical protein